MKVSIVTISFNQAQYLRACIDSVLSQTACNLEYVVVDPGSTDGSREIIESYGNAIITRFEPDLGPADGLNHGLAMCSGDLFCYLNSDDTLLPGALSRVIAWFEKNRDADVIYGHGYIIDELGHVKRKCFSDRFSLRMAAYGCCVVIQPSTFFRLECLRESSGFNLRNKSNWDGELLIDLALAGKRFVRINDILSNYRVHGSGITGSGRLASLHQAYSERMFEKVMKRTRRASDEHVGRVLRAFKHLSHPAAAWERLTKGPIFATKST